MALRQVAYISSAIVPISDAELDILLLKARTRNRVTGITGLLFYLDGNFLQVLEGEDPALEDTYQRIRFDPRHHNLIKMADDEIGTRSFADFEMGFRTITRCEMRENPDLFVAEGGRWMLRDCAGMDQRLKIILETFWRVNMGRSY